MDVDPIAKTPGASRPPALHARPRGRRRILAGAALCLALTVAGCASGGGGTTTSTSPRAAAGTTTPTTTTLPPVEPPSERCNASPEPAAEAIRVTAKDGVRLSAAVAGKGSAGVLLLHHNDADFCQTWPYARYLVQRGFLVLALDARCFGQSECPDGSARGDVLEDVDASVAELRRRGAKKVGVVGGSLGATMALLSGVLGNPRPTAVVSLSGTDVDLATLVGGDRPLLAEEVAPRLRIPVLLMAAPQDRGADAVARKLNGMIPAKDKRLIVYSREESGLHGYSMLIDYANVDSYRKGAAQVASFLRKHLVD